MRRPLFLLLVLLLACACSKKDETKAKMASREAIANDFLHWEKLLGRAAETRISNSPRYTAAAAGSANLIFAYEAAFEKDADIEAAIEQVRQGGLLVTGLHGSSGAQGCRLLDQLARECGAWDLKFETGAEVEARRAEAGESQPKSKTKGDWEAFNYHYLELDEYRAWLPEEIRPERLASGRVAFHEVLQHKGHLPEGIRAFGKNGTQIYSFAIGDGHALFFSDLEVLGWQRMVDATLFYPGHQPEAIETQAVNLLAPWLQSLEGPLSIHSCRIRYQTRVPRIYQWLAGDGLPVTLSLLALVIAFVWQLSRRFGPLLPLADSGRRRSLAEHLNGCVEFGAAEPAARQHLLRRLSQSTRERWIRRHPEASRDEITAAMSQASGIDEGQILQLDQGRSASFTASLQQIRQLRKK
ncbi:MAG: hypothetical protein RL095_787 [Verrucomicrobiota bacterium]|jgi:hypothetical protein